MQKIKVIFLMASMSCIWGCGVKTDPVPPIKPVDIGTGRPLYKTAPDKEDLNQEKSQKNEKKEIENE